MSHLRWDAGKYDEREVENLFVFERAVAMKCVGNVLQAFKAWLARTRKTVLGWVCDEEDGEEFDRLA